MSLHNCSRVLTRALVVRGNLRQQVRHKSQTCTHTRSLNLAAAAKALLEAPPPGTAVVVAATSTTSLRVGFSDGTAREIPYTWLRHNCRCHRCVHGASEGHWGSVDATVHPEIVQTNVHGIVVDWSDGHISKYPGMWLHDQAVMQEPVAMQQRLHAC